MFKTLLIVIAALATYQIGNMAAALRQIADAQQIISSPPAK